MSPFSFGTLSNQTLHREAGAPWISGLCGFSASVMGAQRGDDGWMCISGQMLPSEGNLSFLFLQGWNKIQPPGAPHTIQLPLVHHSGGRCPPSLPGTGVSRLFVEYKGPLWKFPSAFPADTTSQTAWPVPKGWSFYLLSLLHFFTQLLAVHTGDSFDFSVLCVPDFSWSEIQTLFKKEK